MNKKLIKVPSAGTADDSSTPVEHLRSVRRHNAKPHVGGSTGNQEAFKTTHDLPFEIAQHWTGTMLFRVGTCHGQWGCTRDSYYILSVINEEQGNEHLDDVFEWFENSCKRDNKNLLVLCCFNEMFYLHLLTKRGFIPLDADGENVIKVFNSKAYKRLKEKGNEIIVAGTLKCV